MDEPIDEPRHGRNVVERLRQPDYTGENRCLPCTVVNLVLAATVSTALAAVSLPLGVTAFLFSVVVVYLRGYLVPGTPTLTKRYLPERVLARFGKDPTPAYGARGPPTASAGGTVDASTLETAGVATTSADGTLRFTDEFRASLQAASARVAGDVPDDAALSEAFGTDPSDVSTVSGAPAATVGDRLLHWESATARSLDVAAGQALADRLEDWNQLDVESRSHALATVRALVTRCPVCEGTVDATAETPKTCCRDPSPVLFLTCTDCDARLLERETDELEAALGSTDVLPTNPPAVD